MEEAVLKGNSSLGPANLSNLQWIKGSNDYSYSVKKDHKDYLIRVSGEKTDTITSSELITKSLNLPDSAHLNSIPPFTWLSPSQFLFENDGSYYTYDIGNSKSTKVLTLNPRADNVEMEIKSLHAAFTVDNNLFVSTGTNAWQVTREQDRQIICGFAAHRNEFGINKGIFWSPNGTRVAFYRIDQRKETDYPLVKTTFRPAKDSLIKYPMAGMQSQDVTVGVFDIATQKTIYLQTGEPLEQYLTNISWSPDEKYIYIAVLNRDQNHLWLRKYDAASGSFIKTLFEETNDKYVEPLDPLIFVKNKPDQFLWLSSRDGYKHFYLYNTDGKLLRQVTKGPWVVTDFQGFDHAGKYVIYTSTQASPLDRHVYRVSLNGGKPTDLTPVPGYHIGSLSDEGTMLIDRVSSMTIPRMVDIVDLRTPKFDHKSILTSLNPLTDYKLGKIKMVTLKASDGTTLYGRIILPIDFDSTKKYPVVVYVYGGPHVQLVTNSWLGGANLWMEYMAEHGYIMFTLDSRGSYNRGMKFEQATFRNLGTVEMEDQMAGVNYLRRLKYVDTARMGVHGWSFGGFMTTSLMTRYPGVFKVAVAGGPVIDWRYYEVMYTERYMDKPQDNTEGYEKACVLNYVKNLKGRLFLIHGTLDDVVVWQHSLMYLQKAVEEGKMVDYLVYPGHKHNVIGPDRVHLMNKITQYFNDFL